MSRARILVTSLLDKCDNAESMPLSDIIKWSSSLTIGEILHSVKSSPKKPYELRHIHENVLSYFSALDRQSQRFLPMWYKLE